MRYKWSLELFWCHRLGCSGVGLGVGKFVSESVGIGVGLGVRKFVGEFDGSGDGIVVGESVGSGVGLGVGKFVGDLMALVFTAIKFTNKFTGAKPNTTANRFTDTKPNTKVCLS